MADPPDPSDANAPLPSTDETVELVDRVRGGDQEALAILMARFLPRLRRWASGRMPVALRDLADTSDFVQDVLLQSFQRVGRLDVGREGGLQAYLRQAVLNRIRDEFRRSRRRPATVEIDVAHPDEGPSPLEAAIGRQGVERYEQALAALKPLDREAIIARVELGFTYEEVANLLGKPTANAARMAVERALVRLVTELSER
jgi:RNA polymerase sigma-70 factor (ECF subfamily)